jgi:hypothetical protein
VIAVAIFLKVDSKIIGSSSKRVTLKPSLLQQKEESGTTQIPVDAKRFNTNRLSLVAFSNKL